MGRRGSRSEKKCSIRRFPTPPPNHSSDRQKPICAASSSRCAGFARFRRPKLLELARELCRVKIALIVQKKAAGGDPVAAWGWLFMARVVVC